MSAKQDRGGDTKQPSAGARAYEYWLLHRDEPGFAQRPEHDQVQAFGERLKQRVARVMREKGIQ